MFTRLGRHKVVDRSVEKLQDSQHYRNQVKLTVRGAQKMHNELQQQQDAQTELQATLQALVCLNGAARVQDQATHHNLIFVEM